MGERYSATNEGASDRAVGTTQLAGALLGLNSPGTTRRAWVYDLLFGTDGTANDNQINYYLSRHAGSSGHYTGSSVTPTPLDDGAPAAVTEAYDAITGITSLTAGEHLLYFGANQRSTQRWVAAPGGEIIVPAVEDSGVTFSGVHASATPDVAVCMHFWE